MLWILKSLLQQGKIFKKCIRMRIWLLVLMQIGHAKLKILFCMLKQDFLIQTLYGRWLRPAISNTRPAKGTCMAREPYH